MKGFTYADCTVDDSRLVILNVRDAYERGADIRVGQQLLHAERDGEYWCADILDAASGESHAVRARVLVNAAGPWIGEVLNGRLGARSRRVVRLVKGSHIVVPRMYPGEHAYVLQNPDRRIVFVIPYQEQFTLIGTTDVEWPHEPGAVRISIAETEYLCRTVNGYFQNAPSGRVSGVELRRDSHLVRGCRLQGLRIDARLLAGTRCTSGRCAGADRGRR